MDLEKWIPGLQHREEMLAELRMRSVEELFSDLPFTTELALEPSKDEKLVKRDFLEKSQKNVPVLNFLGCGVYQIHVPALVNYLCQRSEFLTSYTPYQAENSQGMLHALFEFQSLMAELTEMDVVNSSVYDGATALGEAALMAKRINRKAEILVPELYWEKRSVLVNYLQGSGMRIVEYPLTDGRIDLGELSRLVSDETSCIYCELPNLLGLIDKNVYRLHELGPLVIVGANPLLLAAIEPPEADIAVGEGQILGLAPSFGGPLLGILGCKKEYVRQMPGRLVGMTHDLDGNRAFCLTLQTREQHIRREKAISNLCTNEALCALASTIYVELLGAKGLRNLTEELMSKAKYLMEGINSLEGFTAPAFEGTYFNEFPVRSDFDWRTINSYLLKNGVQGGFVMESGISLIAVSEEHTRKDLKILIELLGRFR